MTNYDLIKIFFSKENEKMINEKILDDVDYIVPKDRILEYINKILIFHIQTLSNIYRIIRTIER